MARDTSIGSQGRTIELSLDQQARVERLKTELQRVDTELAKTELAQTSTTTWTPVAKAVRVSLEHHRDRLVHELAAAEHPGLDHEDVYEHAHHSKTIGEVSGHAVRSSVFVVNSPIFEAVLSSTAESLTLLDECAQTRAARANPPANVLEAFERASRDALRGTLAAALTLVGGAQRAQRYTAHLQRLHGTLERAGIGLAVLAGGAQAVGQYEDSTATSTVARLADGALSGTGTSLALTNPVTAAVLLVDALQSWVTHVHFTEPIARHLSGSVHYAVGFADSLVTGDTIGLMKLHELSLSGAHGPLLKVAARVGDAFAANGIAGATQALLD